MIGDCMIKLFSMFSGYGGAEFALKKAGIEFECVGYSDIKKHAIKCYDINHPGIKNFGDCTKIIPEEIPDFDLLTGGFPCQTFSMQGKRKGLDDTRGTLIYDVLRIAKIKKPQYMLLENVEGLVTHNDGETLKTILYAIKQIGYDVIYHVFDSSKYGIPQARRRIFFICKFGKWKFNEFKFPTERDLNIFIEDILEKDIDKEKYKLNEKYNLRWGIIHKKNII
jgi:DNA (cytosine-5)-methyltransferase 1